MTELASAQPSTATRVFLVGCARSGTTLLQSMLSGHPDVFSCPETFFFVKAVHSEGTRHRLGLARAGAQDAFATLVELGLAEHIPASRRLPLSEAACARWFVDALDRAAAGSGKPMWLEKTPSHLTRIGAIEQLVSGARFIHMIRAGAPTVASLYDVTHRYPEAWGGGRTLEQCAERWNHDVRSSAASAHRSGHVFVGYERLVAAPDEVMAALCRGLGLRDDADAVERMRDGRDTSAAQVNHDEPWKEGIADEMVDRNDARLDELFSAEQQAHLRRLVEPGENDRARLPFL
jgi:hypothetical protein